MQPYINSEEYQASRTAVDMKLIDFMPGLNQAHQRKSNLQIDMMNDAYAELESKAFVYDAVSSIAFREQVLIL